MKSLIYLISILTINSYALESDLFKFDAIAPAPTLKRYSLYQELGWYIVNDKFIEDNIIKMVDLEKKNELLELELKDCIEKEDPLNFKFIVGGVVVGIGLGAGLIELIRQYKKRRK